MTIRSLFLVAAVLGFTATMPSAPAFATIDDTQNENSALEVEIQQLKTRIDDLQKQETIQQSKNTPVAAADIHDWSGAYAGMDVGVGMANGGVADDFGSSDNFSEMLAQGGFHAGYNYQMKNTVLGAEAEINLGDQDHKGKSMEDGNPLSTKSQIGWSGALLGRAGMAVGDTLFFLDAGPAIAHLHGSSLVSNGLTWTVNTWTPGIKGGIGAEFIVTPNISIRAQYNVLGVATQTDTNTSLCGPTGCRNNWTNMQQTATIGADWHFQ